MFAYPTAFPARCQFNCALLAGVAAPQWTLRFSRDLIERTGWFTTKSWLCSPRYFTGITACRSRRSETSLLEQLLLQQRPSRQRSTEAPDCHGYNHNQREQRRGGVPRGEVGRV